MTPSVNTLGVLKLAAKSLGLTVLFLLVSSQVAFAQRKGRPKVIQLEEIRIEGQVQKPNAFYILNRSNLGYEVLDSQASFLEEIKQTVHGKPF